MAITKLVSDSLGAGVGGSFILLNTNSSDIDVSSFDFDSTYINSTYNTYFVHGVVEAQSDNIDMNIRLSASGSFETGASDYGFEVGDIGANAYEESEGSSLIRMSRHNAGNAAGENFNFYFYLFASQDIGQRTSLQGQASYKLFDSNSFKGTNFSGQRMTPKVHDGIQILPSSGNLQGKVSLYGVYT